MLVSFCRSQTEIPSNVLFLPIKMCRKGIVSFKIVQKKGHKATLAMTLLESLPAVKCDCTVLASGETDLTTEDLNVSILPADALHQPNFAVATVFVASKYSAGTIKLGEQRKQSRSCFLMAWEDSCSPTRIRWS